MPKDRHTKVKLSARISAQALQNLKKYTETFDFDSVSEALEFMLTDAGYVRQFVEDDPQHPDLRRLNIEDEKPYIDEFKASRHQKQG